MKTIIDQLQERIRQVETSNRLDDGEVVKNGCEAIDRLLPERGYPRGTLVQWISGGGQGADFLSLLVAKQACLDGGALVVVDPLNQFFPPAAAALGINLDNLIVLRNDPTNFACQKRGQTLSGQKENTENTVCPPKGQTPFLTPFLANDLLWAIDQSLRCSAVAAVWGPVAEIDERWFRRFQLSAESSGCLGLFLQPPAAAKRPSWAEVQWLVGMNEPPSSSRGFYPAKRGITLPAAAPALCAGLPTPHASRPQVSPACHAQTSSEQPSQHVHLQLTRCRGTHTGKTIQITINHITGSVQPARRDVRALRQKGAKTWEKAS